MGAELHLGGAQLGPMATAVKLFTRKERVYKEAAFYRFSAIVNKKQHM